MRTPTVRRWTLPELPPIPDFRGPWGVGLEGDDHTRQLINQDGAHVGSIGIDPLVPTTNLALAAPELLAAVLDLLPWAMTYIESQRTPLHGDMPFDRITKACEAVSIALGTPYAPRRIGAVPPTATE